MVNLCSKIICPNCRSENFAKNIYCSDCQNLLDRTALNCFDFMSLKSTFELDLDELENQYLTLQKQLHPDNFSREKLPLQLLAVRQASYLNDSYNKLRLDINRAIYLYELEYFNNPLKAENKNNQQLMYQQFELRERLAGGEEKTTLKSEVNAEIFAVKNEISQLFYDAQKNSLNLSQKLAQKIIKLQFFSKFLQELNGSK